jgi:AcrR family transcriptional regulator
MESENPVAAVRTSTRERLLDAAAGLFYQHGVGVGTDALCQAAGVSKRSMYQLFGSKDEVMAASLERAAPTYQAYLLPSGDSGTPRGRILHVFERLEAIAAAPGFYGCPYLATSTELKSLDHPASVVARRYKDELTAFFQYEAGRGGIADPALLAKQLTVVFDGANSRALMYGAGVDTVAVATAVVLLDAVGLRDDLEAPAPG